jgi:hypothetical protein
MMGLMTAGTPRRFDDYSSNRSCREKNGRAGKNTSAQLQGENGQDLSTEILRSGKFGSCYNTLGLSKTSAGRFNGTTVLPGGKGAKKKRKKDS